MSAKRESISFNAGWILGRLTGEDESEGFSRTVPGKHFRVRIDSIWAYTQITEDILELLSTQTDAGDGGPVVFHVMGTVGEMDRVIARSRIRSVDEG